MKVSEVIARLQGMNQDAEVIFPDFLPVVRVVECDGYVVVTDQYFEDEEDDDYNYDDDDDDFENEDDDAFDDDEDRCMGCGCNNCNGNCCK
jgi:hypothetical protein